MDICDTCRYAFEEESFGLLDDLDDEGLAELAGDFGGDIPDHRCERYDNPDTRCSCACYREAQVRSQKRTKGAA